MNSKARWFLGALLIGLTSCAIERTEGWHAGAGPPGGSESNAAALYAQAELDFAVRHEEASLRRALAGYRELIASAPEHYLALVRLARGSFFLAHAFGSSSAEQEQLWDEGAAFAERALATGAAFREQVLDRGQPLEQALASVPVEHVDALYWLAVNLGNWVGLQPALNRIKYLSRIKSLIRRVEELAPTFHHGAVPRYWGGFYAQAPALAGGSLRRSRESFEAAIAQAGEFFENRVLYAELYAVQAGDRTLFQEQLQAVLAARVDGLGDLTPEQIIEQGRARELLSRLEELFP